MPTTTSVDLSNVRDRIVGIDQKVPVLDGSLRSYINFDNAASTPALQDVLDTVNEFMQWYPSVHRDTGLRAKSPRKPTTTRAALWRISSAPIRAIIR